MQYRGRVKGEEANNAYVVAHLYYEQKLIQEEIARRLEVSRPTVARLLARAHRDGIVSIVVREPGRRVADLEAALVEEFRLSAAVVVPGAFDSEHARNVLLSRGAMELFGESTPGVGRVGLGWGRAVLTFVGAVEGGGVPLGSSAELVPLIGGSGQASDVFQINEMVRRAARALGASARLLHAPALVAGGEVREALLAEASVRPVVESWRRLDVAVVGIGGRIDASYQHAFLGDYLGDEALTGAAAGDVCAHYFDIEGRALGGTLEAGLIAVGRKDLRRVPMAIGVAAGPGKVSGILGAVRARLVNALVTDEETAASCLRLSEAAWGHRVEREEG